jgi:hypothetical protein
MSRPDLKDTMLVGSARLETAEETFRTFGGALGPDLSFIPDGEVGERRNFIMHLARRVYLTHPDLEVVTRPAPQGTLRDVWRAASFQDNWRFRVKPGIGEIRFGDPGWRLGYAEAAVNSHFVFRTLRDQGVLPRGLRFQITLPLAGYGCYTFFPDPDDWPKVVPGYEEALRAEIAKICEKIPPEELVFQFDQVSVFDWHGSVQRGDSHVAAMNRERYGAAIAAVAPAVPDAALLGFHLCYGGLEGWPSRRPPLDAVVRAANLSAASAGRRVDYIHFPILPQEEEAYFEALDQLSVGDAKVYLGVVHTMNDPADFARRLAAVRRHLSGFGIAAPCGTRGFPAEAVIDNYRAALEAFRAT